MKITLASESGFCFGIERAVNTVETLLCENKKVCTLGEVLHNPQEVKRLAGLGVLKIDSPEDTPNGYNVVIRSHGVDKSVYSSLAERGIQYLDATCPYVRKIQDIASKASVQGKTVLIAGDKNHPEIIGICSHCSEWHSFISPKELEELVENVPDNTEKEYILIAQTTFDVKKWYECREIASNAYTKLEIFDTICNATMLRQKSAENLAIESDCMIVVGGQNSSNTAKLAEICEKHCKTFHIESPNELEEFDFGDMHNIGVTAGASTPAFIIKEVLKKMSDMDTNMNEMSFEEMLDESFKTISTHDKVTGVVTSVTPNEIAVDIGTKHAGYVPLYEYTDDPTVDLTKEVKPGDEIELTVLRLNDAEGTALLSKKRLDAMAGFDKIVEAEEKGEVLSGAVVDVVKGGVIALCNSVRVFIPASHATVPRGGDLNELKGTTVEFKILETNRNRRRAVGSVRDVLLGQRKELADKFWETAEVDQTYKGVVKSLTSYGAFIDLGGVDGMAHISELSWSRIKHPSDVLTVGETVEVYIKELDKEARKISLGYKKTDDNPWAVMERDYKVGDVVTIKIVSMTSFGAFAQVIPGVDGLIHISQISNERVEKPSDVLTIGQEVQAAITDVDLERKRVSLSIRALLDEEELAAEAAGTEPEVVAQAGPDAVTVEETEADTE